MYVTELPAPTTDVPWDGGVDTVTVTGVSRRPLSFARTGTATAVSSPVAAASATAAGWPSGSRFTGADAACDSVVGMLLKQPKSALSE